MDNSKNIFGVILLIIIILLFSVGGYFFMEYCLNLNDDEVSNNTSSDIRIDETKDYIYYDNTEEIVEEIYKEDVIINIEGLESINDTLHNELNDLTSNIVTTSEVDTDTTCSNDIYSFSYREYVDTEYQDYLSLVIYDYTYSCVDGTIPEEMKSYVIDKTTGSIYTEEELLSIFNITEEEILEYVEDRLNDTQVLEGEEQIIDIEGTLTDLKNNLYGTTKALSISKNGNLVINYIVKSNKINYNDSIELD